MTLSSKALLLSTVLFIFIISSSSCRKPESLTDDSTIIAEPVLLNKFALNQSDDQKIEFAKILSKAVNEDKELRQFLKSEALKQFNFDYDILYHAVKNNLIAGKESFRDKLLKYTDEDKLITIEKNQPLLTIFIPELPSGWSAKNWDISNEIPLICPAIRSESQDAFYFKSDSIEYVLKTDMIPANPVLAVKDNERVVVSSSISKSNAKGLSSTISSDDFSYSFASQYFDKSNSSRSKDQGASTRSISTPIRISSATPRGPLGNYEFQVPWSEAVQSYPGFTSGIEWQRDYTYYGLTPYNQNGPLKTGTTEYLRWIQFKDGFSAYQKIADQDGDPKTIPTIFSLGLPAWTEGDFELRFTFLINSSNGLGTDFDVLFPVRPRDLFISHYDKKGVNYYQLRDLQPIPYDVNLPIVTWDIQTTGFAWKVMISETDLTEVITKSYSHSTELATNFGFNTTLGKVTKLGLNFGASAKSTTIRNYSIVSNLGDDDLGTAAMAFSDEIIFEAVPFYEQHLSTFIIPAYETGYILFSVIPRQ